METYFFTCKLNTANKSSMSKKLNKIDEGLSQNEPLLIRKSQDLLKIKKNIESIRNQNSIK